MASGALAFKGVTVIDVTDGRLLPEQTVVVSGNRVQAVGPTGQVSVPVGAQVVDARGKYLIPGLWDMHAHMDNMHENDRIDIAFVDSLYRANYPRFIAHGVTGLREMAQRFPNGADSFRVWQREVLAGTRIGPRAVGPSADVVSILYPVRPKPGVARIGMPDDARRIADSLKAAGMRFIKFHDDFALPELYFALARESRRVGLPLVGHTPYQVSDVQIADSGQRNVEHLNEVRCWFPLDGNSGPPKKWPRDTVAEQACAGPAAAAFLRNGTWITPTFTAFRPFKPRPNSDQDPKWISRARTYQDGRRMVRTLHGLGIKNFLAGTDFVAGIGTEGPREPRWPGLSLLEELGFLVEAGLTPLEALQAATLNPAKFFQATDSLGMVTPGKLADLVLLDANPLVAIHNVMQIQAVVANGHYFDRAALDALVPKGE